MSKTLLHVLISPAELFPGGRYHILLDTVGQTTSRPISQRSVLFPGEPSSRGWGTDRRKEILDNWFQLWAPLPAQRKVPWEAELFQRLFWHRGHAWCSWGHQVNSWNSVTVRAVYTPTQLRSGYWKATYWPPYGYSKPLLCQIGVLLLEKERWESR